MTVRFLKAHRNWRAGDVASPADAAALIAAGIAEPCGKLFTPPVAVEPEPEPAVEPEVKPEVTDEQQIRYPIRRGTHSRADAE